MLTPNGRFELNKKICLSFTGYHPEYWQPAWGIRTVLMALIGFFPTKGEGAVGALDYSDSERKHLAKISCSWACTVCGLDKCAVLNNDDAGTPISRPTTDIDSQTLDLLKMGLSFETHDSTYYTEGDHNDSKKSLTEVDPKANTVDPPKSTEKNPDISPQDSSSPASMKENDDANRDDNQKVEQTISNPNPQQPQPQPHHLIDNKRLDTIICGLVAIIVFLILRRVP